MQHTLDRIFTTSRYHSQISKEQAKTVYLIIVLMLSLYTVFNFVNRSATTGLNFFELAQINSALGAALALFYGGAVMGLIANAMGLSRLARACPLAMWFASGIVFGMQGGFNSFTSGLALPVFLILAGLMLRERGVIIAVPFSIIILAVGLTLRVNLRVVPTFAASVSDLVTGSIELIGIGGLLYGFLRLIRINRREAESGSREQRLRLANITTEVAQRISRRMALQDVLSNAVEQVRESYPDIYHVQIFLVDDARESAHLAASTGEVGRKLMERQHALQIGSQSVIGQVTAKGAPVVARSDSSETVHRRNELLPETRVEAAFPLRIGDVVIGALDLQSKLPDSFQQDDLPIFQSLADHMAIAIDNARLFDETEKNLQENQKLVEQSRQAIAEVERLNQRLTGRFWDDFLSDQESNTTGISVHFDSPRDRQELTWTPTLEEAIRSNHPIQQQDSGQRVVALPLRVRGQVIGAMEFELDAGGKLSTEDMNLLEEVGEQLGLAAETTRLFQGSQRLAQREALVNEIATRLQTSNNVETTLTEAARSLRDALRAEKVVIRLGPPPTNGKNGGQA